MNNLFAYGTLMCDDIMRTVAGCLPLSVSGTLRGYQCVKVRNATYPAIVGNETGVVHGILYQAIPAAAWEMLDRFEGDMYKRTPVTIETDGDGSRMAFVYICKPAFLKNLDWSGWDFHEFLHHGKKQFLEGYAGFGDSNSGNPVR